MGLKLSLMSEKFRKSSINGFIVLNLLTVFYFNSPSWFTPLIQRLAEPLPAPLKSSWAFIQRSFGQYGHVTGMNGRWFMFGHQSRFNWWFFIMSTHFDGQTVALPLERQSSRTFWQDVLFDFKEAKFHLNLLTMERARLAYARYLCRQYPEAGGLPIQSIVFEIHQQRILPPQEAASANGHLSNQIRAQVFLNYPCVN